MASKKRGRAETARTLDLALARAGTVLSLSRAICRNRCSVLAWIKGEKSPTHASMARLRAYLHGALTVEDGEVRREKPAQ